VGTRDSAVARAGDLELRIAVAGTDLRVSLRNLGDRSLAVQFAVEGPGGRRHHDALSVRLASPDGRRTLRFTGNRNVSASGVVELAAGDAAADALDLAAWALADINGCAPLAAGDHELTATYRPDIPGAWSGTIGAGPVALRVP
jgi:hypothetical protein